MNRLRTALIGIGLLITLLSVSGAADSVVSMYETGSWRNAVGWLHRLPHAAPFALIGVAIGALLIVLSRRT